jgi:GNAT superfamily N-acetyltransferase
MAGSVSGQFYIRPFELKDQNEARQIILLGLEERFDFLDETLNSDVDHIHDHFILPGDEFYVGILHDAMVCTGGLIKETADIGRVVRVSVLKELRRSGFATLMMEKLELAAQKKCYKKLVLETNKSWDWW